MAKQRWTEDQIVRFAFFLALEGLEKPPPGSWLPRLFPADLWTQEEIFECVRQGFGRDAAKLVRSMRLFTEH